MEGKKGEKKATSHKSLEWSVACQLPRVFPLTHSKQMKTSFKKEVHQKPLYWRPSAPAAGRRANTGAVVGDTEVQWESCGSHRSDRHCIDFTVGWMRRTAGGALQNRVQGYMMRKKLQYLIPALNIAKTISLLTMLKQLINY